MKVEFARPAAIRRPSPSAPARNIEREHLRARRGRTTVLLSLWLLGLPVFGAGTVRAGTESRSNPSPPATRAELWTRQRIEKEVQVRPEENRPVERFLMWIEDKGAAQETLNIHYRRLYPGGGIDRPFSGLAFGGRYWHADLGNSELDSRSSAALRGGFLRFDVGSGNDRALADTKAQFSDEQAPGLNRQPDIFRVEGTVFWDTRDKPGNPHRGGLLGFSLGRFREISGNEFRFNRYALDSRYFLPLGSRQRILATRFFTSLSDADSGSRVPFFLQQSLGGRDTLRGFREMRFRDENLIYLSAEYRWEAAVFLEFAVFYDAGKVVSRRSDYNLTGLEKSPGFGVRIKSPYSVFLRLDVSRSREGSQVHFRFGPSF